MMPSASPKQRVLIVGAKFGEMYLNAFMQPPEGLELVGLLAQGSARSRELAHAFGIPLYTSPEQITRMPDIACIVVRSTVAGGTGTQLARHFLTRGVHVIQEHPLHPDEKKNRRRRNRYAACQTLSDARRTRHSGASPPPG
ncbi:Thiazolinyl-S-HMWP1 reductase YbtU [Escherichia coli SHECO001]|nr:Thiazolinyl-S-HMWP1 reductase YbtU [Escherichia coli SHECO001]